MIHYFKKLTAARKLTTAVKRAVNKAIDTHKLNLFIAPEVRRFPTEYIADDEHVEPSSGSDDGDDDDDDDDGS